MNHRKILAAAGILAPPLYFLTILIVGMVRKDYNFINQLISQLTQPTAPYQHLLTASFLTFNALTMLFAVRMMVLVHDVGQWRRLGYAGTSLFILLGIAGTLRVLFFPMDPLGAPPTLRGITHISLAGIGSITALGILFVFGAWFRRVRLPYPIANYSTGSGWVLFGAVVAAGVAALIHAPWEGLAEKLAVVVFIQWMFVMGIRLFVNS